MHASRLWSIVVAAGTSLRFSAAAGCSKQHLLVGGHPLFCYSLYTLSRVAGMCGIVLVIAPDDTESALALARCTWPVPILTCVGGALRCDSVRNGLRSLLPWAAADDWVFVHDAARPVVMDTDCSALLMALQRSAVRGAFLAYPEVDALKEKTKEGLLGDADLFVARDVLSYRALTPQVFRYHDLQVALAQETPYRDEVSAILASFGALPIETVVTGPHNIKLTYPCDLPMMKRLLEAHPLFVSSLPQPFLRVGQGYDSHRWGSDLPLVIGGVVIPYHKGLVGHSDADVLLHALMDALLGGCGLQDIGHYFPNSDSRYRGADSKGLLHFLCRDVIQDYRVVNMDATIIAEEPRLMPFVDLMKESIASILSIPTTRVGIKCKTAESMGALGRKEGIVAQVVVLLVEK